MTPDDVTETMRRRVLTEYEPDLNSGCWLWSGATSSHGYGMVYGNRRTTPTHRVSYVVHKGLIGAGLHVRHSCDTPACINPAHLSLGTHADNMRDASRRGRAYTGSKRFDSLPINIRQEAIQRVAAGEPRRKVARDLDIHANSIRYWEKRASKEAERG